MIPIQAALINMEDLRATETEIETLRANLVNAQGKIDTQFAQLTENDATINRIAGECQDLAKDNTELKKTVDNLTARLLEASKPAIPRKPTITKTDINGVMGLAIPKGNAPSPTQDDNTRDLMMMASFMGMNTWRGFFNLVEVKSHISSTMTEGNINNLPGYGRRWGLTFIADTVNWAAVNLSDVDLPVYLNGLVKMGAAAFYFDDANQYRDTTKYPAGTLERMVGRIRAITPNVPLIASLTANAAIASYKPLFDHVEAQTFGTIPELQTFLTRGFDVYCLDGRKEISIDYLTKAADIIAQGNPRNLFLYVTGITDWKAIPEKLPLIKQLIARWTSLSR